MWFRSALLLVLVLALPASTLARGDVVGGRATDIREAPWTALISIATPTVSGHCSGVLIDASHVATSAHCVDHGSRGRVGPESIRVIMGVSDVSASRPSDVPQERSVARYRIHPDFVWHTTGEGDDVAVLELDRPVDLSGAATKAIALATAVQPAVSSAVRFDGFGSTLRSASPELELNSMFTTVSGCNHRDGAVLFCAVSNMSAMCAGDSGGGLVSESATPELIGIATAAGCSAGTVGWFVNVGAPEIRRFLQGDDNPPRAPRDITAPRMVTAGPPRVGQALECAHGRWSGAPAFGYQFRNEFGRLLQASAASRYVVRQRDVSHRIVCRVSASNVGGLSTAEAVPTAQVRPRVR